MAAAKDGCHQALLRQGKRPAIPDKSDAPHRWGVVRGEEEEPDWTCNSQWKAKLAAWMPTRYRLPFAGRSGQHPPVVITVPQRPHDSGPVPGGSRRS